MNNSPLEFLAKKYENVVKYDAEGNIAGVFVKFKKCKSSDLDSRLPGRTHPAFIIDGVEQDYILLGKYKAVSNGSSNGAILSAPNDFPVTAITADAGWTRVKKAGQSIMPMTVADYGFIKLLANKLGWEPHGNTACGQDIKDGYTLWTPTGTASENDIVAYRGYTYKCITTHTKDADHKPSESPTFWKLIDYIGGVAEEFTNTSTNCATMTGTGPATWYLGDDVGSLADISGSCMEIMAGYRIVNAEIQICENNDAASPNGFEWKVIKPGSTATNYTLVTAQTNGNTTGALKWNYVNKKDLVLDTVATDVVSAGTVKISDITVNPDNVSAVPIIMYELGLLPLSDAKYDGVFKFNGLVSTSYVAAGQDSMSNPNSGFFDLESLNSAKTAKHIGFRPRAI